MKKGFTLLEGLVTVAMLGGLVVIIFMVFSTGVSGFKVGTNRLGLQSEMRRVLTPLRKDLQNSSFQSLSTVALPTSVPQKPPQITPLVVVQRDGLCMSGLRNMSKSDSYDKDTGLPIWDCYICYFATLDNPDGKMIRMMLRDSKPGTAGKPLFLLGSDLSLANPALISNSLRVLSDQMMEFGVTLDPSNQLVNLHLKFRSKVGRQSMGGRSLVEVMEIRTTVDPINTNPRL